MSSAIEKLKSVIHTTYIHTTTYKKVNKYLHNKPTVMFSFCTFLQKKKTFVKNPITIVLRSAPLNQFIRSEK